MKTDRRDAENIARNLALNTYKEVQMVTSKDEEIKEYIRMRDDHKRALTKIKQQIKAFLLRHGKRYDRSDKKKWRQDSLLFSHFAHNLGGSRHLF